ncbi:MAG: hypothetical protein ACYS7Y_26895 [Planctomycetota bacterium]|jgi:hypothetical protein
MGPNVKKLVARRMSQLMIPPGGGFADGIKAIQTMDLPKVGREATAWVMEAIQAVKDAPGGGDYGDDEAIALAILEKCEERECKRRWGGGDGA